MKKSICKPFSEIDSLVTVAQVSAANADVSANASQESAVQSSLSASAAQNSENTAEIYRDQSLGFFTQTQGLYQDFSTRFLGVKSSPPLTDNDGNPLVDGALYYDTGASSFYVWQGAAWTTTFVFSEVTPFLATGTTTARNLVTRSADIANVKDFGAVGDGVADDTVAIQAALTASQHIFIPSGVYRTTAPLTKNGEHWTIYGAGYRNTIIRPDPGTFNVFEFSDAPTAVFGCSMSALSIIDTSGDRQGGAFVKFFSRPIESRFEWLHFDGYYDGFDMVAAGRVFFQNIIAHQNARTGGKARYTFNLHDDPAFIGKVTDVHFVNVQGLGFAASSLGEAHVRINTMDGVYMTNSHFIGFDYCLRFDPNNVGDQNTVASLHVSNTYFDRSYLGHVLFAGNADIYRSFHFSNTTFRESLGNNGNIVVGTNISDLHLANCNVRTANRYGLVTTTTAVISTGTIVGTRFENNNTSDTTTGGDIRINASDFFVLGSVFESGGASGTSVTFLSGSQDCALIGCSTGSSTAGTKVVDSGSATKIALTAGYVTDNYGTAFPTTDANGNAVIAHGLAKTPTFATVSIRGDTTHEATVEAVSSTNITVRVRNTTTNADTGNTSVVIYWEARV
jgi:hypothetical protein